MTEIFRSRWIQTKHPTLWLVLVFGAWLVFALEFYRTTHVVYVTLGFWSANLTFFAFLTALMELTDDILVLWQLRRLNRYRRVTR